MATGVAANFLVAIILKMLHIQPSKLFGTIKRYALLLRVLFNNIPNIVEVI